MNSTIAKMLSAHSSISAAKLWSATSPLPRLLQKVAGSPRAAPAHSARQPPRQPSPQAAPRVAGSRIGSRSDSSAWSAIIVKRRFSLSTECIGMKIHLSNGK